MVLTILVGMLGCELSPPLQPLATNPSPSPVTSASPTTAPTPTPVVRALRGIVSGNQGPLVGARVSLGTLAATTAAASASVLDATGTPVTLAQGEFLLLQVPAGSHSLTFAYDGISRTQAVSIQATGTTSVPPLVLPVDGPVPDGSTALSAGTSTSMIEVQKASPSAALVFTPDRVTIQVKAPPNSKGSTIGAYAFTYVHAGDATISPTIVWTLPSVVVLPALGPSESGPSVDLTALIKNTSSTLQSTWDFNPPDAMLKIEFRQALDGPPVLDRDGKPLTVLLNCLLVP